MAAASSEPVSLPGHPAGAVEQLLLAWCEEVTGAAVLEAVPLPGGNRRRAWAVDVAATGGGRRPLFLRFASNQAISADDPYDLGREALLYRALAASGVPLPALVAQHPTMQAVLFERVAGDADFRGLTDGEARTRIAREFMQALHRLHALDPQALGIGPVASITEHVRDELRVWRGMYESTRRLDPLIEFALRWLDAHVPHLSQRAAVVHGDAGPGNFMFAHGRLAALIDWELWHLGDPVEDIAWVSMRSVLEPLPDFALRVREYEELAGAPVDRSRLLYHRIFVTLRVAVIRHRALLEPSPDSDPGNSLVSRLVNRRLLVEALGAALQLPHQPFRPLEAPATPRSLEYEYLLKQLRDVVAPAVADPVASRRVKGMARVLKHLQQQDQLGPAFAQEELRDLQAALNQPLGDVDGGRLSLAIDIREGRISTTTAFIYLQRQSARETALGAGALGQLTTRGFESLDHPSYDT